MAHRGVLQPGLLVWLQNNTSSNAVMTSNSPAHGNHGVAHPPSIHSTGCEGSPQSGLVNSNFAWAHDGLRVPLMEDATSENWPQVNVNDWSSSERKKFLIDYLMAHVNHDDLLIGALLVLANKGMPVSCAEEEAALDEDARAAQEALFKQTENARPSANTDDAATPFSAAPPFPPPMLGPSYGAATPFSAAPPPPPPMVAPSYDGATPFSAAPAPPPPMAVASYDAATPFSAVPPSRPHILALLRTEAGVLSMQEKQAWMNAVLAENMALRQELAATCQSSVQHEPPVEMRLPMCHSFADRLPETMEEPVPQGKSGIGGESGVGRATNEVHQMFAAGAAYNGQYWPSGMG